MMEIPFRRRKWINYVFGRIGIDDGNSSSQCTSILCTVYRVPISINITINYLLVFSMVKDNADDFRIEKIIIMNAKSCRQLRLPPYRLPLSSDEKEKLRLCGFHLRYFKQNAFLLVCHGRMGWKLTRCLLCVCVCVEEVAICLLKTFMYWSETDIIPTNFLHWITTFTT